MLRRARRPAVDEFGESALHVLLRADAEARRRGRGTVAVEHLLAALASEENGALDAEALGSIGIDVDEVRRRVEEAFGAGALERVGARRVRYARSGRRALERARTEARARGSSTIEREHLAAGVFGWC